VAQRAFSSQLAVSEVSLTAFALAEAVACGVRGAPRDAIWCLGLWALPLTAVALAAAWLLAALCDEGAVLEELARGWSQRSLRDAALLGVAGASILGACVFGAERATTSFHNRELVAAGLALTTAACALLLGLLGFVAWQRLRTKSALLLPLLALSVCLGVGLPIFGQSLSGLVQLDPRLLAAPLSGGLAFTLADRSARLRQHAQAVLGATLGLLALAWAVFLLAPGDAGPRLASGGAWTRPLIAALERATDFDGDGFSSLLGGGDCAPFDPAVHPGAPEIAGDGIDNNCIGGDGGKASAPERPIWGSSVHGSPSNLNVVLVTIETLRRDHASFVEARHDTTPNLRGLASSSLVFERMYSAASYTRLALASLFSSYAPSEIDWLERPETHRRYIGPSTPWLPELLAARGYETIAVLTDFSAFTAQEAIGFERGFQHYDTSTRLEYRGGTMRGFPAAAEVDRALGYLQQAKRPFLLWLHLFEPHFRYEQPPGAPVFGPDDQARYDAEIWHVDHELGRLFEGLRSLGVWDSTVLFVSGDHGESFGEHDDRWHGTNLFDPQLRPAALLRVPGIAGKRVGVAVTFTDVAPTLCRVLGDRQSFDRLRGRSLAPLMHHSALPESERGFVAETFNIEDGQAYQAAVVTQSLKLIYTEQGKRFALYDLRLDPRELEPIEPSSDPRAAPLLSELVAYLERARPRALTAR
jgi:arylsulfatase A-like enzyme